jgi:hypothetical protein
MGIPDARGVESITGGIVLMFGIGGRLNASVTRIGSFFYSDCLAPPTRNKTLDCNTVLNKQKFLKIGWRDDESSELEGSRFYENHNFTSL